jgi:hypothetical protein
VGMLVETEQYGQEMLALGYIMHNNNNNNNKNLIK